ncbi:Trehalose transport system permease protein SugB [subsurface metagenome]|nr:ABC transporter permease subunit [Clostridia bacterium]
MHFLRLLRKNYMRALGYFILILASVLVLIPIAWAFNLSLKEPIEITRNSTGWIFKPTLENYISVFLKGDFREQFFNSLIIGLSSTFIALIVGLPAAYTLSRFRFKGKNHVVFWLLSTRMAPPVATIIPYFIIFSSIGLMDTHIAIIIMHLTANLVLVIWIMMGFFADLPQDITDAAMVDGCSYWSSFIRISLPLVRGGMVATSILSFMFSWNELMFALVLSGPSVKTAPVGVFNFIGFLQVEWGPLMAASTTLLIPIFIFIIVVQKALVRGLTFGAVK